MLLKLFSIETNCLSFLCKFNLMYTTAYIRWYYWYKNFWDELLLLWVISYLVKKYGLSCFVIQTPDPDRLDQWMNMHVLWDTITIHTTNSFPLLLPKKSLLVLWWWEVLTDARVFPYNGWSYFVKHGFQLFFSDYIILWWVWTIKKRGTDFLYKIILKHAISVVMRDYSSYTIASAYTKKAVHYHDFAFDALADESYLSLGDSDQEAPIHIWETDYIIINVNVHIRNHQTIEKLKSHLSTYDETRFAFYFFPASVWNDDSDSLLLPSLKDIFSSIQMIDWTDFSLVQIEQFFQWSRLVISARLHVVLMGLHSWVPTIPLVYQEKVQRLMDEFPSSVQ